VLNEEFAATPPTVYLTIKDPDAPEFPAVPPAPFPLALLGHCALCAPQLAPVVVTFE
jgi:hypothetical protein